jgi:hypothetical protein
MHIRVGFGQRSRILSLVVLFHVEHLIWHGVEAGGAERTATSEPAGSQPDAAEGAMSFDSLVRIVRAAGLEPAEVAEAGRYTLLVAMNEQHD